MQIDETLKVLFEQRDEIPLFYVESGSRLWDIASPDSDFDVRGFHLQSRQKYFDFRKHRDIIEVMDGDFDLVSYDIDKMFGLLAKCNPTVFESRCLNGSARISAILISCIVRYDWRVESKVSSKRILPIATSKKPAR